ncbi:hypothetical protein [Streptomyces sp. NPDC047315]|uniref:hypothetical protein n=1 Tax=Streptomyces sp. NPDC047315 TaxID=3155142 RepID=UPI0034018301
MPRRRTTRALGQLALWADEEDEPDPQDRWGVPADAGRPATRPTRDRTHKPMRTIHPLESYL